MLDGLALCAGTGGLELGLQLALGGSYRTVAYVEREAFAAATLVARMEDKALDRAPVWDDLKSFDGTPWRGLVDLISGGYPCQPFSTAGQRLGASDPRHLWPEFARLIREIQPSLVFCENVDAHLRLGFAEVYGELHSLGYTVEAGVFSAAEMGAPHLRKRLFFLAYLDTGRGRRELADAGRSSLDPHEPRGSERQGGQGSALVGEGGAAVAHAHAGRCGRGPDGSTRQSDEGTGWAADGRADVADTLRGEWKPRAGRERVLDLRASMGDATGSGRQDGPATRELSRRSPSAGDLVGYSNGADVAIRERRAVAGSFPAPFPPGPESLAEWIGVLERDPTLEPALRGMVDGMASRVDRLRACGNGVVPVVAAVAFTALWRRLNDEL